MKKLALILLIGFASVKTFAQTSIAAKDAAKHIGEEVTITDKIYGGKFLAGPGITLLDVGGAHPNESLVLLIKGDDRKKFTGNPEETLKGKAVTITGKIIDYKGKPEIVITEATQIKVTETK